MEDIITLPAIIALVFFFVKFIEQRFVSKEPKPMKEILMNSIIVFVSGILGMFLSEQFGMAKALIESKDSPTAFVTSPDF
jgi:hypothetical protein